jgi:hypothetical protein
MVMNKELKKELKLAKGTVDYKQIKHYVNRVNFSNVLERGNDEKTLLHIFQDFEIRQTF